MTDPAERAREMLGSQPAETMPDDVAARLDAVLHDEARRRSARAAPGDRPAVVVPLRDRVRRRLPSLAAAAVLVGLVGVGLPLVLRDVVSRNDSAGSSAAKSQDATAGDGAGSSSGSGKDEVAPDLAVRRVVRLSASRFDATVTREIVRRGLTADLVPAPALATLRCSGERLVAPSGLPVRVDGRAARLYASGPAGERRFRAVACVSEQPQVVADTVLDTAGR